LRPIVNRVEQTKDDSVILAAFAQYRPIHRVPLTGTAIIAPID
jgi:hypothetical protein